jgi:2-polyprenyl-3-methyl-5-hydroxy-6-metoxy-1,4-benzoquinol methylase
MRKREVVNYCAKAGASEFNKDNHNVELLEMEAKDMEFRDLFDVIFAVDVIEHIPDEEMQLVYSKVYSALKNVS